MKKIIFFIFAMIIFVPVSQAYGHGLGLDTTKSMMYGEREIAMTVELSPMYFTESENKQIRINAFDKSEKKNLSNVTFLVGLFKNDEMLFRKYFFADSGELLIDVENTESNEVKIVGVQDDLLGAWHPTDESLIKISGPVFNSGGLYHFEIEIRSIDEPTNIIDSLNEYTADISTVETTYHSQKNSKGDDVVFRNKSYYDNISNFQYDPKQKEVTVKMPFDWGTQNISHLQVVHEEIFFPQDLSELISPSYVGKVNGIDVFKSSLQIDDFSEEGGRIVHFILLPDHVKFLKTSLKKQGQLPEEMEFSLIPNDSIKFPVSAYTKGEEFVVDLSWDPPRIQPDESTRFIFTVRDAPTLEPLRGSDFKFVVFKDGMQISENMEKATVGGGFLDYRFSETGTYKLNFENIRGTDQYTSFTVLVGELTDNVVEIPDWVKNNAKWWAEGGISDNDFASGIEFMIKEGIIIVPVTDSGQKSDAVIPDWVKNNAKWWAEGQIDDQTFANGLQFLIKVGIISV